MKYPYSAFINTIHSGVAINNNFILFIKIRISCIDIIYSIIHAQIAGQMCNVDTPINNARVDLQMIFDFLNDYTCLVTHTQQHDPLATIFWNCKTKISVEKITILQGNAFNDEASTFYIRSQATNIGMVKGRIWGVSNRIRI